MYDGKNIDIYNDYRLAILMYNVGMVTMDVVVNHGVFIWYPERNQSLRFQPEGVHFPDVLAWVANVRDPEKFGWELNQEDGKSIVRTVHEIAVQMAEEFFDELKGCRKIKMGE